MAKANQLFEVQRYADAKKYIQEYLQTNFNDPYAFCLLALCELNLDKLTAAGKAARQSLAIDPEFALAHYVSGLIYGTSENFKKSNAALREALRLDPQNVDFIHAAAQMYYHAGQVAKATEMIEKGLYFDPNHSDLLQLRGLINFSKDNKLEGYKDLREALKQNPNDVHSLVAYGYTLMDQKKYADAKATFLSALAQEPTNEEAKQGLFETQKTASFFFRIFYKFGFSRWYIKSKWRLIIFGLLFIKTIPVAGSAFSLFLLATWYGDVLYNTLFRLKKEAAFLLTPSKIQQSNYLLISTAIGVILFALGNWLQSDVFYKLFIISGLLIFTGLAYFEVELKRRRRSILITTGVLLFFSVIAFSEGLLIFSILHLLLLVIFGLLFSFRVIGW